jgi:glucose/arabinose dehydrogenase
MTLGDKGTLFVGTRSDKVYAVVDSNNDGRAEKVVTVADGLRMPNGVAFHKGSLYIAEIARIVRIDNIEDNLEHPPRPVVINDSYPDREHHGWKFIAFSPDGLLYVPIGVPCDVCIPPEEIFGSITRIKPDGTEREIFAKGIRNTVGFDWHPVTHELWFTDNGRDWMGDDLPPDELNRAPEKGMNFGFPYIHGKDIRDPKYGKGKSPGDFSPPEKELGPHVAALGMRFYTGKMFPREYNNNIFIAEHGSWNRSTPIGYRVMIVTLKDNRAIRYDVFAEGWLQGKERWGRPVDVQVMPDGSLLVSDDFAGVIYRITYSEKEGNKR